MRAWLISALIGAATLATVACSSTSQTSTSDTNKTGAPTQSEQTEEALKSVVVANANAILHNDATVSYGYLSASCREQWKSVGDWGANVGAGLLLVKSFVGVDPAQAKAGEVNVLEFTPTKARATVEWVGPDGKPITFGSSESDGTEYVYEDGGWRSTECQSTKDGFSTGTTAAGGGSNTTIGGELKPAGEAEESAKRSKNKQGAVGERIENNGVVITVSEVGPPPAGRTPSDPKSVLVQAAVRIENRTSTDVNYSSVKIVCANGEDGNYYMGDSSATVTSMDPNKAIPSGSFAEGSIMLDRPAACPDPVIRISTGMTGPAVDVPLPNA